MSDWTRGYSEAELDDAQARFGLVFPPDLVALLRERSPARGYDWRSGDAAIRSALRAPLEGLLFDVEVNALWWPEWGERPATAPERAAIVTAIVARAPPLVPLIGHRYLPGEPHAPGNPVFSIVQSDVIYYGTDLDDYFRREFSPPGLPDPVEGRPRHIPFWSDLVERNC